MITTLERRVTQVAQPVDQERILAELRVLEDECYERNMLFLLPVVRAEAAQKLGRPIQG